MSKDDAAQNDKNWPRHEPVELIYTQDAIYVNTGDPMPNGLPGKLGLRVKDEQAKHILSLLRSAGGDCIAVPREKLEEIAEALDESLGDSDITHLETDEEVREEEPAQWACSEVNKLLNAAPSPELSHTDHPVRVFDRTCPACVAESNVTPPGVAEICPEPPRYTASDRSAPSPEGTPASSGDATKAWLRSATGDAKDAARWRAAVAQGEFPIKRSGLWFHVIRPGGVMIERESVEEIIDEVIAAMDSKRKS